MLPRLINKPLLHIINASYAKAVSDAMNNQNLTSREIRQLQINKFISLINHSKKSVPYYNEVLNNVQIKSLGDLLKIPFLTKDLIRKNKQGLMSGKAPNSRFKPNSTSGSTGEAMSFFSDKKNNVVRHACTIRGDSWTGWRFGEPKVVLWGATRDTNKSHTLKGKLASSRFLFNSTMLSSFDMRDADMSDYVKVINKKRPTLIVGYPSSLEVFSKFIRDEKLAVTPPKGIITGGETLHEYQREIIQEVFKTKVLNRYGGREVGHIANECEQQNGLHVSMDHVIVEIINEKGSPCKPGELGEVVVTDLDNYVFPFIRYRVGDLGAWSEKECACGRPFQMLDRVEGRTFDVIIGTNGNRVPGNFFTLLKYKINGVDQFQIFQKQRNKVEFLIKANERYNKEEETKAISLLKEKLGRDMQVCVKKVDKLHYTKAGKFRWVVSEINKHD